MPAPIPDFPATALAKLPEDRRPVLAGRVGRLWPQAAAALDAVYGNHPDWPAWRDRIAERLADLAAARPEDLSTLDAVREADPLWFQDQRMLGYSTYVDRFAGTLRGVAEKLDYLTELGVRYLHLLPPFRPEPGDSDGGFAVADHLDIDPRLGTIADLEALGRQLRARGISLCLDYVMNHTAASHRWAEAASAGDPVCRDYYLVFPDRTLPDRFEATLDQVFPQTAPGNFTDVPGLGWVWTTFYPFQWDLNWANPAVFAEMLGVMLGLANAGAEVLRVDSAAFIWKQEGTDCRNRPQVHRLLQALRALAGIAAPALLLKAEAIVPARHLTPYFGTGDAGGRECQLAYHNTFMAALWLALATGRADRVGEMLARMPAIPEGTAWVTYLRCHDDIGWAALVPELGADADQVLRNLSAFYAGKLPGSFARGKAFQTGAEDGAHGTNGMLAALAGLESALAAADSAGTDTTAVEAAFRRIRLLHGVLFGFGGLPVLYMGDEIALLNDWEGAASELDGRWLHRPRFPWDRVADRHDPATPAGRVWQGLRQLVETRARLPALHAGVPTLPIPLPGRPHLLALLRPHPQHPLLVLANFADRPEPFPAAALPAPFRQPLVDVLTGEELDGSTAWDMNPSAVYWLEPRR